MSRFASRKVGDGYSTKTPRSSGRAPGRSTSNPIESSLEPPDKRPRLNSRPSTDDASAASRFLSQNSDLLLSIPKVQSPDEIDDGQLSSSVNGTLDMLNDSLHDAVSVASSSQNSLPAAPSLSAGVEHHLALLDYSVSKLSLQDPPIPATPPRTTAKPFAPVTTRSPEYTRIR